MENNLNKYGKPKKRIPKYLHDDYGNIYPMILESHRDGFNLVTYRQEWDDYITEE
jgi:hypothetical protein